MLKDLIEKNRSYRRFYESQTISETLLKELVDLARLSATAGNRQPLRFIVSAQPEKNAAVFSTLGWAAALKDWNGPAEGERPAGYIVILKDTSVTKAPTVDEGIAAQSILLGAVEKGLGGCMFGSVKRAALASLLGIDDRYEILLVVALGKPKEEIVIEPVPENGSTTYWRTPDQVHHVPKLSLNDLIL